MSSKKLNIFSAYFDSYADALYKYLDSKGIEKVWLAEKITNEGKKVPSTQEKLSRWKREGTKPSKEVRSKINDLLSITIHQDKTGKWKISHREQDFNQINDQPVPWSVDQLLKEERSRLGIVDIPDTERGRELQDMLDDAVSLLLKIRRSIEKEKKRSNG